MVPPHRRLRGDPGSGERGGDAVSNLRPFGGDFAVLCVPLHRPAIGLGSWRNLVARTRGAVRGLPRAGSGARAGPGEGPSEESGKAFGCRVERILRRVPPYAGGRGRDTGSAESVERTAPAAAARRERVFPAKPGAAFVSDVPFTPRAARAGAGSVRRQMCGVSRGRAAHNRRPGARMRLMPHAGSSAIPAVAVREPPDRDLPGGRCDDPDRSTAVVVADRRRRAVCEAEHNHAHRDGAADRGAAAGRPSYFPRRNSAKAR